MLLTIQDICIKWLPLFLVSWINKSSLSMYIENSHKDLPSEAAVHFAPFPYPLSTSKHFSSGHLEELAEGKLNA